MIAISRLLLGALSLAASIVAVAQPAYPSKPIRLIVPFPAGGSTDPVARLIGQELAEALGQPIVIDNRPGANTIIGTDAAAKAPADGHTLLYTASTHVINSLLMPTLPYDGVKDFQPVASIVRSDFILVVNATVPATNLREFIAQAKAQPGTLNYATSGNGNPNHLAGEYFGMVAGVRLNSVPYKGGGPAINDLLGGQVHAMFSVPTAVAGHIKTGKLRAFGYTGSKPVPGLTLTSFADAGLPGFELSSWNGIFAPAGTPKPIVDRLSAEIGKILAKPEIVEKLALQGQEPWHQNAAQFAVTLASEREKYASIIKTADIKLD